jgi:hypothetical protein
MKLFLVNVNQDGTSVFKYVVMVKIVLCDSTWPQKAGAWSILADEQPHKAEVLNIRTHHANHPQRAVESKPGNVTDPYISIRALNSPQWLTLICRMQEVPGTQIGPVTTTTDFLHSAPRKAGITWTKTRLLFTTPFHIHYSLTIPPFNTNLRCCSIVK